MKIDIFPHILPPRYLTALRHKASPGFYLEEVIAVTPGLTDLDLRFRIMDKHGVVQVLTTSGPPLEGAATPQNAAELAMIANDEMAELVARYPDRFVAAVAALPMNDMEAALREADRAIRDLHFKGVQLYTPINGKPLDSPELVPLYQKMVEYDLPIWLHPQRGRAAADYATEHFSRYWIFSAFGWPYETTAAMTRLVFSGILERFPTLKVITHHSGGMVPFFEQRVAGGYDYAETTVGASFSRRLTRPPLEYFRRFYADTAIYGSTPGLMCAYAFFGPQRLLFGTDMPFDSQQGEKYTRQTIHSVEHMAIPDAEKELIFSGNATRLLRLPV